MSNAGCPLAICCIPGLSLCPVCDARLRAAVAAVNACGLPIGALVLSKAPTLRIISETRSDVARLRRGCANDEPRFAATATALAALTALGAV